MKHRGKTAAQSAMVNPRMQVHNVTVAPLPASSNQRKPLMVGGVRQYRYPVLAKFAGRKHRGIK